MIKLMFVICASLFLVVSFNGVADAQDGEEEGQISVEKYCAQIGGKYGVDHATCVACATEGPDVAPECVCESLGVEAFGAGGRFENRPQCVKVFTRLFTEDLGSVD